MKTLKQERHEAQAEWQALKTKLEVALEFVSPLCFRVGVTRAIAKNAGHKLQAETLAGLHAELAKAEHGLALALHKTEAFAADAQWEFEIAVELDAERKLREKSGETGKEGSLK